MRLCAAFILLPCLAWGQQAKPVLIPRPVDMTLTTGVLGLDCPLGVHPNSGFPPLEAMLHAEINALHPPPHLA